MSLPTIEEFLESLYGLHDSTREQLKLAQESGDAQRIKQMRILVHKCEKMIVQAGGHVDD